jgi:membrane protease YdiL (CAAX protease family)
MTRTTPTTLRIVTPIAIAVGGLLSVILIAWLLDHKIFPLLVISDHSLVNLTFTMQMMVFPISFIAMGLLYLYNREGFKTFFRLGFANNPDWNLNGLLIGVAFTLGNVFMMSMSVTSQHGVINDSFFKLLPLVFLFSATNAWSEEIFTRFVIVAGLSGKLKADTICWISGSIFGLAHFSGTPNGVFGVIMSGLLGWLLAKSVVETRGLGWALLIHFLQDVVIFGSGAMVIAGQ